MGFRDPITTIAAVDTGADANGAGARLYQDLSNPAVPQGVAEWRTGFMARNATARLSGGGSGGSAFTLDGGRSQGIDAPSLSLNVESAPTSGYRPIARFSGVPRGIEILDSRALTLNTFIQPYGGASSAPTVERDAAGWVHLSGLLAVVGAPSLSNGYTLATLPDENPSWRPAKQRMFAQAGGFSAARPWRCDVNANGTVVFVAPMASDWSFPTGVSAGYLSLDGISFRPAID
jgi:hypothetical protein